MRAATARDLAARYRYARQDINAAAWAALAEVKRLGGDGGLIAVDRQGNIAMPYNARGMKRAAVSHVMVPIVRIFEPEAPPLMKSA